MDEDARFDYLDRLDVLTRRVQFSGHMLAMCKDSESAILWRNQLRIDRLNLSAHKQRRTTQTKLVAS